MSIPFAPAAIGYPGSSPAFPNTECLSKGTFKVIVPSWRRLNPAQSTTGDYIVDVTTYAPKMPLITRMHLVDIDVPQVQQLIEANWSRLYFQQGVTLSTACRSLEFTVDEVATASVVLPLPADPVKYYEPIGDGVVRLSMTHRAPTPIYTVADMWHRLPDKRGMRVFGIPLYPDGFLLTKDNVAVSEAGGTMSFDVVSYEFYGAVTALPANSPLLLVSSVVPGPNYLAAILTKASTAALAELCTQPICGDTPCRDLPAPSSQWYAQFVYSMVDDKFTFYYGVPRRLRSVVLTGPLVEYMGLPSPLPLDVLATTSTQTVVAPNIRLQPVEAYARLPSFSPKTADELAAATQLAFNTYSWSAFSFGVQFAGQALVTYTVPAGRMTQAALAETVSGLLAGVNIVVVSLSNDDGSKSGLHFSSSVGNVFSLDWTVDGTFDPVRVGYDPLVYPYATEHFPTRRGEHVPGMDSQCSPPRCDTWVTYNGDTQQLTLQSVPFAPFAAVATALTTPFTFKVSTTTTGGFKHGLQVGARVVLADGVGGQFVGYVLDVLNLFDFMLLSTSAAAGPVTVVPQDRLPIDLFFQQNAARVQCTNPNVFGFHPNTYVSTGELTGPGAVDIRQDPYILLCITFRVGESGNYGEVYYPFDNGTSNIVFAKILRNSLVFNCAYDRNFGYSFPGTGVNLGYIGVKLLNSDGTLYETHGQPVSICLRFEVRESGVEYGAAGTLVCLNSITK